MPDLLFQDWFFALGVANTSLNRPANLFCFPFAGAGPSNYHALCKSFSAELTPFVARLPGREGRRNIPAFTDVHAIADALAAAISPVAAEHPAVFWGHSMGALVAFELTRRLPKASQPRLLVLSGHQAPQLARTRRSIRIEELSDERFVDLVKAYGGTPPVVFENRELLDIFLPQLRADLTALENYSYQTGPPLACDLLCLNGTTDHLVGRGGADAWEHQTAGRFDTQLIPGGHFFLNESRDQTVEAILAASFAALRTQQSSGLC